MNKIWNSYCHGSGFAPSYGGDHTMASSLSYGRMIDDIPDGVGSGFEICISFLTGIGWKDATEKSDLTRRGNDKHSSTSVT